MDKKRAIHVMYGVDGVEMAYALVEAAGLADRIGAKDRRILLKPNLVNATVASQGATTHPEMVEGIIRYLKDHQFTNIVIAEGSWVGGRTAEAFQVCGYEELSKKYNIRLIDTQRCSYVKDTINHVSFSIVDCYDKDMFLINIPVLKAHCQTILTCALKNMKGLITDAEKRRFHMLGLHKPIGLLNKAIRQDFIVVDAICGDLVFEEGGNPFEMNMAFCCDDPVLCDSYACSLMGFETEEVPYIAIAESCGVGSSDLQSAEVIPLNHGQPRKIKMSRRAQKLAEYTEAKEACSSCYGSLIHALSKLEKKRKLPSEKICIGQGYRGKTGSIGVGYCTKNFTKTTPGCPPTASEVLAFLESME